jgi:hypothetical protein
MKRGFAILLALLIGSAVSAGCAAVGFTLLSVGAGVGASAGISFTFDSIPYKRFTASEEWLRVTTFKSPNGMDMKANENRPTDSGRRILAEAEDRAVEIELDRLTAKTSRMQDNVKQGWFLRDRATAAEIVVQTERALEDELRPARKVGSPAEAAALKK